MGEHERKQNHICLFPQRKEKSWLRSPSSSVSVKDKHTHTDNVVGELAMVCVHAMSTEWMDLASRTPPLRHHIRLYEFECRLKSRQGGNQQPLVSITTHKL